MNIVYYITAHGYGHGVRSCDMLRALRKKAPDARLIVRSNLPRSFFDDRIPETGIEHGLAAFDVGMVQRDAVRSDVPETLKRISEMYARSEALVESEARFLAEQGAHVAVCDIPALPIQAAARAGVRSIAVGNFSWDWIYEAFMDRDPGWRGIVESFREGYRMTDLLLRLPFAGDLSVFPRAVDIPLCSAPGRDRREEIAALTGADVGQTWVLIAFTKLDWNEAAIRRINRREGYRFFTMKPLEWTGPRMHAVDRSRVSFQDVLASSDIVLSKPGYGIVSECCANAKPMIYIDREDFREHEKLVEGIRRYLKNVRLPQEQLYRGDIGEALRAMATRPAPREAPPLGGAERAAEHIVMQVGD